VTSDARIITAKACRPSTITRLAELFLAKCTKSRRESYRRFATAAEAIRYAVETLRTPKAFGASLEVGDERFKSSTTTQDGLLKAA
jgi:predicted transcriptional regulator